MLALSVIMLSVTTILLSVTTILLGRHITRLEARVLRLEHPDWRERVLRTEEQARTIAAEQRRNQWFR